MTMQAVDGKHEGFMGHIISVAGVEVDGVVITSPYVHAISDKCALHFEEGSGLLSMSSVLLRYIGIAPLRTSARSICMAMALLPSRFGTSIRGVFNGLIKRADLHKEKISVTADSLAFTMDVRCWCPSP